MKQRLIKGNGGTDIGPDSCVSAAATKAVTHAVVEIEEADEAFRALQSCLFACLPACLLWWCWRCWADSFRFPDMVAAGIWVSLPCLAFVLSYGGVNPL